MIEASGTLCSPSTYNGLTLFFSKWWSKKSAFYLDKIADSNSLIEVFSTINGRNEGSGRKLLHSMHMISTIFGEMTIYEVLRSSRVDGFWALGRQSTAILLNMYSNLLAYAFTLVHVLFKFRNALVNKEAAFCIARDFKTMNSALAVEYPSAV